MYSIFIEQSFRALKHKLNWRVFSLSSLHILVPRFLSRFVSRLKYMCPACAPLPKLCAPCAPGRGTFYSLFITDVYNCFSIFLDDVITPQGVPGPNECMCVLKIIVSEIYIHELGSVPIFSKIRPFWIFHCFKTICYCSMPRFCRFHCLWCRKNVIFMICISNLVSAPIFR